MNLPSPPDTFSAGEKLTAAKLNKIVEWTKAADREIRANEIRPGAGILFARGSGGTSLSVARAFVASDTPETAETYTPPFTVTLEIDTDTEIDDDGNETETTTKTLRCAGGKWRGNGALPNSGALNGTTSFTGKADTFDIPECTYDASEIASGTLFAVILYAPAVCGVLTDAPAVYYLDLSESSPAALFAKLRAYNYSSASIIGIWKLTDDALDATDLPGQILASDFWYRNTNAYSLGKFGWSAIDGAANSFRVNDGLVLVRPNSYAWQPSPGAILTFSEIASTETVSVGFEQPVYSIKNTSAEVSFLKSVAIGETTASATGTTTVSVSIPYYKQNITFSSVSVPSVSVGSATATGTATATRTFVATAKISKDWETTTITANPYSNSSPDVYSGILTSSSDVTLTTTLYTPSGSVSVDVPSVSVSSDSITVATATTVATEGSKTVSIDVPTYSVDAPETTTELATVSYLKTATLSSSTTELSTDIDINQKTVVPAAADDETAAALFTEFGWSSTELQSGDSDESASFAPSLHSVAGTEFAFSDDELSSGVIVLLYCAVTSGNCLAATWSTIPAASSSTLSLGEIPQTLALSIQGKLPNAGTSDAAFGVIAGMSTANYGTFSAAFPMAVIQNINGETVVQPLANGVLTFTPSLAVTLNTSTVPAQTSFSGTDPTTPDTSELLASETFTTETSTSTTSQATVSRAIRAQSVFAAQAALRRMAAIEAGTASAIFPDENADFDAALNFVA